MQKVEQLIAAQSTAWMSDFFTRIQFELRDTILISKRRLLQSSECAFRYGCPLGIRFCSQQRLPPAWAEVCADATPALSPVVVVCREPIPSL